MDLYKQDKYPVLIGKGTHAALCTAWNEPSKLVARIPKLLEEFVLVGSLYTRAGVSAILRNLALNPSRIRQIIVWNNGPLSRNKNGRSGTDVLEGLWHNGIASDGLVFGSTYRLEKELDVEFVRRITKDVTLNMVGDIDDASLLPALISAGATATAREPRSFPAPEPVVVSRWPSERVGWMVHERTIFDAWQRVVMNIMRYGVEKGTQYGMRARELIGFAWVVTDEDPDAFSVPADWPAELANLTGASKERIADYLPTILTPNHGPTTYGAMLRAYPAGETPLDQVEQVLIRNFRESPDARRAVATTMIPAQHWNSKEPPCLTTIQCLQADGRLNLLANLRSHDIFKGALPNAVGLRQMQKMIATELGFELGELMIVSASAHIYESDWEAALKTIDCAFLGRDPRAILAAEEYDQRGNYLIQVVEDVINVTLRSADGVELHIMQNKRASRIMDRIAQLGLVTHPNHLMYLGGELMKAEIAIRLNRPYEQDKI